MRNIQFLTASLLLLLSFSQTTNAATIRVNQLWHALNFSNNGMTAETVGIFDDSSITGTGVELVALSRFTMATYTFGIGQNFNIANLSDPPTLSQEGNIAAIYQNGIFQQLSHVSLGGSARIGLINGNNGGFAGGINISGGELIWHFPVSGTREYRLQTTNLTNLSVPVPEPATLWLLLSSIGLFTFSRRLQLIKKRGPL